MLSLLKKLSIPFFLLFIILCCVRLIFCSLSVPLPKEGETPHLYSNQSRNDLRLIYIHAIQQAQQSIHMVMFGLSDVAILNALSKQQLPLAIYYDANESFHVRSQLKGADLHPVHRNGLMHQKILILDRNLILVGSANMTEQSLRMHDNLVVGMVSPKIAEFLLEHTPPSSGHLRTTVGKQDVELWLLPDPHGQTLSDLRQILHEANHCIKIAIFTFTHTHLCDELIEAHQRGVAVTVVIDTHSGLGASSKTVNRLKQNGITVLFSQGVQLLHHKFAWIDDQILVCGSTNWTVAAFNKNSDLLLALRQLTQDQKEFMQQLWHRIETESRKTE